MRRMLALVALSSLIVACETATNAGASAPAPPAAPAEAPAATPMDQQKPAGPPVFDSSKAFEHLRQMVGIGPRPSGSEALRQTRAYITRQLSAAGLTTEEQRFTAQTPIGPIEMVNLITRLPGKRTDRILFTGHYDTKLMKGGQPFVGASDGASSAAFLIELARVLKDQPREFTYEFIWFDGEEAVVTWGTPLPNGEFDRTYGSRYYVKQAQKANALASIKAMILVDMIGDRNLTIKREATSTAWLKDIIWGAAKRLGHGAIFQDEETPIDDDHMEFLAVGVPSVDIIDPEYPEWHHEERCCDDLSKVGARSLQIVGDVLLAALPEIEKRAAK
jgi:glutaminyl-peptide cyclotransferase